MRPTWEPKGTKRKVNSMATTMKLLLLLQSSNQHCLYLWVTISKHLEVSPREGLQQRMDRNFFIIPWGCKL